MKKTILALLLSLFGLSLQAQDYEGYIGGFFMLVDSMDAPKGYCFDLERFGRDTGTDAPVIVHACKAGFWKDGTWMVDYPEMGKIYAPAFDLCAAADSLTHGADLILEACSDAPLQQFVFHENGKVLVENDPAFCLGVADTSQGSGAGVRRRTLIVDCDELDDSYTTWVVPREGTIYPPIGYTAPAPVAQPTAATGGGAGPGGPGEDHQYVRACAPCHGGSGEGYQSEHAPKLSGLSDWYLTRQMGSYKYGLRGHHEGERWATQMSFHVEGFSEEQITSFVDYIVTLEDLPSTATISGDVTRGETLYTQACVACHGVDGMGIEALSAPRVAGMSDWYMAAQLEKYRDGLRGDHPEDAFGTQMVPIVKMLPDEQALNDVVSYINTLAN